MQDSIDTPNTPKFIGEGSYGCVIKPAIKCSSPTYPLGKGRRTNKNTIVSKIFETKDNFMKEVNRTRLAIQVDPKGESLLLPTKACNASYENINKNSASKKCESLDDFMFGNSMKLNSASPMAYQLHMPYGGVRFDKHLKSMYDSAVPVTPYKLLIMIKPLIKGLELLEKSKVCHQDIKGGNLLCTPQNEAIIIDFSLMVSYADIYSTKNSSRWKYSYNPYPPEYKIYYYLRSGQAQSDASILRSAYENIKSFGDDREQAYGEFYSRKEFNKLASETIRHFRSVPIDELEKLASTYCEKIDLYSVGMVMVAVYKYIDKSNPKANELLKEFIKTLMNPSVLMRASVKDVTSNYKKLVKQIKSI